jgi:hypothetical protein
MLLDFCPDFAGQGSGRPQRLLFLDNLDGFPALRMSKDCQIDN